MLAAKVAQTLRNLARADLALRDCLRVSRGRADENGGGNVGGGGRFDGDRRSEGTFDVRLLRSYEDAVRSADPLERVTAHALNWLVAMVPTTLAAFYPVDARMLQGTTGPIVVKLNGLAWEDAAEAYTRYMRRCYADDPFAAWRFAVGNQAIVTIDDVGGPEAFARTAYARALLLPFGLASQTTLHLRQHGRIVAGVTLLGKPRHRSGRTRDLVLLHRGHRFLEEAYALLRELEPVRQAPQGPGLDTLTARELAVAQLVATGATNDEVARALTVTPATVKTHLVHIFAKLHVRSRTELALAVARTIAIWQQPVGPEGYDVSPKSVSPGSTAARTRPPR
jgi:DNA-binding CsgD family transcriptional regulator